MNDLAKILKSKIRLVERHLDKKLAYMNLYTFVTEVLGNLPSIGENIMRGVLTSQLGEYHIAISRSWRNHYVSIFSGRNLRSYYIEADGSGVKYVEVRQSFEPWQEEVVYKYEF